MIYLILSIICSVTVGVIFKIARQFNINVSQVVAWNYIFALLLCYLFFSPDISQADSFSPWFIYVSLAFLMPFIFIFLAASINHIGIVKTDAAQRLSLFIPVLASYFIFKENFNLYKIIGLTVGFLAIMLIFSKKDENSSNKWLYPVIVLFGFGIVDVLFKKIATQTALPFTTSLFIVFCGALAVAWVYVLYERIVKKKSFLLISFAFGTLIGIFNFGNILFYLKAHKAFAENPSTVFAAMNMGVIVLGGLVGIVIFKEKVSKLNYFGLFLALVAIVFISFSQIYKG